MLTFVARRLLLAVPVLLGVIFAVMLTVELIPGDAVALMLGEHATPDAVARLRDYLGLDKPLLVRYAAYVWPPRLGWPPAWSPRCGPTPSSTRLPAWARSSASRCRCSGPVSC